MELPQTLIASRLSHADSYRYGVWKPAVEFVLAVLLLLAFAPLILVLAWLVRWTSRGPAFYTQIRVGRKGKLFTIYKLRTMTHDSESDTGPVWAQPRDPRITWLGKILRDTHLDELPQLVNILRGDMSLVGPRPERPKIVQYLESKIGGYLSRLEVRPGITGLAQVLLPPDVDLEGVRKKLICDLHYIDHFSAWTDWRILICTGLFFAGVPLRFGRRLLRIPEPLRNEPAGARAAIEVKPEIPDRKKVLAPC